MYLRIYKTLLGLDWFCLVYKIKPLAQVTKHSLYLSALSLSITYSSAFPTFHSHLSSIRTRQLYTILICLGPLHCSLFLRESNFQNLRSLNKRIVMQLSAQCETNGNNLKQIANWTPPVVSTFWARASVPRPFLHLCHETLAGQSQASEGEARRVSRTVWHATLHLLHNQGRKGSGAEGKWTGGRRLELLLLGTVTRPKYSRTIFNIAGKYWEYLPQMLHDI